MNILVTGGCGFVGSHLVDYLMERENKVTVLDNLSSGTISNVEKWLSHPNFNFIHADVTETVNLKNINQIYHLASLASPLQYNRNQIKTLDANILGTKNMLELAHQNSARMLFASSSEVYGDPKISPQHEKYLGNVNCYGPRSCYDEGKRAGEALCYAYSREKGVEVTCARIFNAYGPRMSKDDGRIVSNFMTQALNGEKITIYGDGYQTRSLLYITDLVDGLILLMGSSFVGTMNIGSCAEKSVLEYARLILSMCASKSPISHTEALVDDPRQRRPDITLAQSILKWSPKVSVEDGLQLTKEYYEITQKYLSDE